jgi:hypothetical protein
MVNPEKIGKQAKKIMDSFVAALKHAGKIDSDFKVHRDKNIRDESAKLSVPDGFQERIFNNAPKVKNNCILAEKKKW